MAREMTAGDSATATVGTSGSVVGKNTSLMHTVKDVIFSGVMLNMLTGNGSPTMRPGDSMMNALGGSTEVYSTKPQSDLTKCVMGLCLLGFAAKLIDNNTAPPPSQEALRAEAIAKDDMRLAGIIKEDALKKEAFMEEEARRAFFNKPPRM